MKEMNFTTAAIAGKYRLKTLVICYVVSVLISAALKQVVIHQMGVHTTLEGAPGFSELTVSAFAVFNILLYMWRPS
jgi:hypothetical protein